MKFSRTGFLGWASLLCAGIGLSLPALAQSFPPNSNQVGAWSALGGWPLIALHAVLTPGGNVLTYGTDEGGQQTGKFIYDVWDPTQGSVSGGHLTLPNTTNTDIFCSAQIVLPQGDIFLAGGDNYVNGATNNLGNRDTNIFAPADNSLTPSAKMNRVRWYATTTTLPSGEIFIQGGKGGSDRPEVRSAFSGFRLLSIDTSGLDWHYPRNFVAPDGRIFGIDTAGRLYYIAADFSTLTRVGAIAVVGRGSSAAMYAPGKILQIGGTSNGAVTIDINGATPKVTATAKLSTRRDLVTVTLLPDGKVLATGGSGKWNELVDVNNSAEIWNPATGKWTVGTSGSVARLYHSIAMLLPDASVLVAGGGAPGPLINTNAEIYYPPYLFDASGGFAPRPTIVSAPNSMVPGSSFNIDVGASDTISRVSLLKTGSVTHSWNMDQRAVPMNWAQNGSTLTVSLPANPNLMPPGFYLLFVLNAQGVPSLGKMLNVDSLMSTGGGSGLKGQYFNDTTLTTPTPLETVGPINFDWGTASPGPSVNSDGFSARWSGQVEMPFSGTYRLRTISDDGTRVYLDGQLVIDNWTDHLATIDTSVPIAYSAGAKPNITVEYYDKTGGALMRLLWQVPGALDFVPIPTERLHPDTSVGEPIDPSVDYSLVNRNSNKCVGINAASLASGAYAVQQSCNGTLSQKFKLVPTDSGYYRLVVQHTGMVLRVASGSLVDGAKVLQTNWVNAGSYQWKPVPVGGYYKFINRASKKVLEVPGCSLAEAARLQQWGDANNSCQAFRLQP